MEVKSAQFDMSGMEEVKEQSPSLDFGDENIGNDSLSMGSSGSGLEGSASEDDSRDEVTVASRSTTATVIGGKRSAELSSRLRQTIFILFIYLAISSPLVIYIRSRGNEVHSFENDFQSLGSQVIESFGLRLSRMYTSMDSFSISATSSALQTNSTWPFVTMSNFGLRAASALDLSTTGYIAYMPLVTDDAREAWEKYSLDNLWWLEESLDREFGYGYGETSRSLQQITNFTADGVSEKIYQYVYTGNTALPLVHPGPGPYTPMWQMEPPIPAFINLENVFDLLERDVQDLVVSDSTAVFGREQKWIGFDEGTTDAIWEYYSDMLKNMLEDETAVYDGEPISNFYYPVFSSFRVDRQVVGLFRSNIFWREFFFDILSVGSNGIVCVLSNECGDKFSFEIDGSGAKFLGDGDVHDADYDYLAMSFQFNDIVSSGYEFSSTAAPLITTYCPWLLEVYPSDQLQQVHITDGPMTNALVVFLIFVVFAFLYTVYDCVIQARMKRILGAALENRALVASMYPEAFRERLFAEQDEAPVFSMGAPSKMRLKAMLGQDKDKEKKKSSPDLDLLTAKPIADLYPHCTVIFIDIPGFSAWSSERQPEQVFMLLETIFQTFDKIARRRGVFKVETIGDSYVAVTGLPDPQSDHALRMARFAKDAMSKAHDTTKMLEAKLGPDTGELKMRIGLHSGQVTAGVLRGEKSRFQLFGDTMNTASRMETTGIQNRIQVSHTTAQLLIEAGKEKWIVPREDTVKAKGKGVVQTYWIVPDKANDAASVGSAFSFTSFSESSMQTSTDVSFEELDEVFHKDPTQGLWGENEGVFTLPPSARTAKSERLVDWLTDIIAHDLKKLVALRAIQNRRSSIHDYPDPSSTIAKKDMPLDEVVEAFEMPTFNSKAILTPETVDAVVLPRNVKEQLRDFVSRVRHWYRGNPFHNFEHASHVTMSSVKLLRRIVTPDGVDYSDANVESIASDLHSLTFGITTDPMCQFAVTMACLIHDVDHTGVGNGQLSKENPTLGQKYREQSIAEQNSVDIAWDLLMEPSYKALQHYIFTNEVELQRFRQYLVNLVCATDIFNKEQKTMRNERWNKAFSGVDVPANLPHKRLQHGESTITSVSAVPYEGEAFNRKATIVLEHIIQAADVSHTMQHWNVYVKWNERLFQEMYQAFDNGRGGSDPTEGWYKGELWFFDNYIIPLSQKLEECGVFGVSSDECLNYALENRKEWAIRGKDIVKEMAERYQKRKMLEVDGFTNDEIEAFTAEDLDHILRRLIKKGRSYATFRSQTREGQMNAAKAWCHALELHERSDVKLADKTVIFPIYSGLFVFIKGGMVLQSGNFEFEQNMSNAFVASARRNGDPVHHARALALKCEVLARAGKFEEALNTFKTMSNIYEFEEHSQLFNSMYGTDRAAQMYSRRAQWLYLMGRKEEAFKQCDDVVNKILPWMDTQNVLNTFELLFPVLSMLKARGQSSYASDLFEENVLTNYNTLAKKVTMCAPILVPLSMLLRIIGNPNDHKTVTKAREWLLGDDKHGSFDIFLDNLYSKLGWTPSSITAELCLATAKHSGTEIDENTKHELIRKGLRLARYAGNLMEGKIGVEMAMEAHQPVLDELTFMAELAGIIASCVMPGNIPVDAGKPLRTKHGEIQLVSE